MISSLTTPLPKPARPFIVLTAGCLVAALLSTAQIYLRQRLADQSPELGSLILLNLIAWAPWVPIASAVSILGRRFPLQRRTWWVHGAAALGASCAFLLYLALFRLVTQGLPVNPAAVWSAFAAEVGEFFLVCLLLYGAILATGPLLLQSSAEAPGGTTDGRDGARLEVRSRGVTRYIDATSIDWISAEGAYVGLHVDGTRRLLRGSMTEMADRLARSGFVRIHRSTIVNRERVVSHRPLAKGDAEVELRDGTVLRMSRRYRASFAD